MFNVVWVGVRVKNYFYNKLTFTVKPISELWLFYSYLRDTFF